MSRSKMDSEQPAVHQPNLELLYLDNAQMKMMFKISDTTLWRWRRDKLIKFKKVRRKFYYSYHLVVNFMKARAEEV